MEKKVFWITFTVLGLLADFLLPIWWAWPRPFPSSSHPGGSLTAAIGSKLRKLQDLVIVKNVSPLTLHSALPFRVQVPVMVALVSV